MFGNIKIFGERNTATNALKRLIELNSAARCLPSVSEEVSPEGRMRADVLAHRLRRFTRSGRLAGYLRERAIDKIFAEAPGRHTWKHAATKFESPSIFNGSAIIFTVRHPGSWLLSLHRNPYNLYGAGHLTLSEFATRSWASHARDRLDRRTFTPLELYAAKLQSYLDFMEELERHGIEYHLLRFETVVTDQNAAFDQIRPLLASPSTAFRPLERSTKPGGKTLAYYGNERWRDELGDNIRLVNRYVSPALAGQFGYRL